MLAQFGDDARGSAESRGTIYIEYEYLESFCVYFWSAS